MRNLILVLGDQLNFDSPALENFDPSQDCVLMIEAVGVSIGHAPFCKSGGRAWLAV